MRDSDGKLRPTPCLPCPAVSRRSWWSKFWLHPNAPPAPAEEEPPAEQQPPPAARPIVDAELGELLQLASLVK